MKNGRNGIKRLSVCISAGSVVFCPTLFLIAALFASLGISTRALASESEPGKIVGVQFENDLFGGGTDRHFTHGSRIFAVTKPIDWIADMADKVPWFSMDKAMKEGRERLQARSAVSLGQNIFTPADITETELIEDDRPYAGWLYMGFGIAANQGTKRFDQLELNIGVVGPSSMAEDVQTTWHDWFDLGEPEGWDNQLRDELGVVLYYEQARRFDVKEFALGLKWDFMPHFGGAVGNVHTFGKLGFTCRLGPDLTVDFGPPRIRPSMPGSGFYKAGDRLTWYLFVGGEARLVAHNIFLDGNTFKDSHSVDKKPLTGDVQVGLVMQYSGLRISYTQIFRAQEFNGQDDADKFGSFAISYQF